MDFKTAALLVVILVVACYYLQTQETPQPSTSFLERLMSRNPSGSNERAKRSTSTNSTLYEVEVTISTSDLELLRKLLGITYPVLINDTSEVLSTDTTTVCAFGSSGYQCMCEANYVWSFDQCMSSGACSPIFGDTCSCINELPADEAFCQLNSNQRGVTTLAPTTTTSLLPTAADPVLYQVDIVSSVPVSVMPSDFMGELKRRLAVVTYPFDVTPVLEVDGVNITTACFPSTSGDLSCQCEDQFAWSCDKCQQFGACSNSTEPICSCIGGLPDGQFCEPITTTVTTTMPLTTGASMSIETSLTTGMSATTETSTKVAAPAQTIPTTYQVEECVDDTTETFTCEMDSDQQYRMEVPLSFTNRDNIKCVSSEYGNGSVGHIGRANCDDGKVGIKTAECLENGKYGKEEDFCIVKIIKSLLDISESNLQPADVPGFVATLSTETNKAAGEINGSPATMRAMVRILRNVANVELIIEESPMTSILETASVLTRDDARKTWDELNMKDSQNTSSYSDSDSASSTFLNSLERFTGRLADTGSFVIEVPLVLLNKTSFTNTFNFDFNSSVEVDIPQSDGINKSLTVIVFDSMDNVLPPRDEKDASYYIINGNVALIRSSGEIDNISLTFDLLNNTLYSPKCVFWNFTLFDGLGGWDDEGCRLVYNVNDTVSCSCDHLTSFSILMSPFPLDSLALSIITYIGVTISMASLVICLVIEAIIWNRIRKNSTSYLRHVSIVNIALSLLIANIWFIIGASISDPGKQNKPACTAATYFIHFFYLALFFWMLSSALLLAYRTLSVFGGGCSDGAMLGIGFALGYGAPLIIASITIASTAPTKYIQSGGVCWLNWFDSKAMLAFVIPALMIVFVNLIILFVVLYKILRRRIGSTNMQEGEKHVLFVIAKSLAVLTPFFGLTWGLGIGTMVDPYNEGIHIAFAFFNSLQGFFILVFGTLLDKRVLSDLKATSDSLFSGTRSTSGGHSSSGLGFFRNLKINGGRGGYHVSSAGSGARSSSVDGSGSGSFSDT